LSGWRTTLHFAAALLLASIASGAILFLEFLIISGISNSLEGKPIGFGWIVEPNYFVEATNLLFVFGLCIAITGIAGGIPGIAIGAALLLARVRSIWWYIAGGVSAGSVAPLALTAAASASSPYSAFPILRVLMLSLVPGSVAGATAWLYVKHLTPLLKRSSAN